MSKFQKSPSFLTGNLGFGMKMLIFCGHDFKDFSGIFDRIQDIAFRAVSLSFVNSGGLLGIMNDVFCVGGAF